MRLNGPYRHKPLGLQRCTKCSSPKLISYHTARGGIFTPWWSSLRPLVGLSPVPLEQTHRSLRLLLALGFGLVPGSPTAGAWRWAQPKPPGPFPSGTCRRRVPAALGLRVSHCSPTFSSVGGEQKLLPSSLWEGTGCRFSSADQWLLSRTA